MKQKSGPFLFLFVHFGSDGRLKIMSSTFVGFLLVAFVFVIGFLLIALKSLLSGESFVSAIDISRVGKNLPCPKCKTNLAPKLIQIQKNSVKESLRYSCTECGHASHWEISGYPPTLIESKQAPKVS